MNNVAERDPRGFEFSASEALRLADAAGEAYEVCPECGGEYVEPVDFLRGSSEVFFVHEGGKSSHAGCSVSVDELEALEERLEGREDG